MSYLQGMTRPDISMAVHKAMRFCIDLKLSHKRAIQRIGKDIIGIAEKWIVFIL